MVFNLGTNIGVLGQFRLGRLYLKRNASVETGATTLPTGESQLKGWQAILDFDQFDRAFYPTKGWSARTSYYRDDDLGYSKFTADLRAAHSWGPYVLNGRFSYVGSPEGRLPISNAGTLGGFLNLSGFVLNQIIADDLRFFSIRGERVIGKMPLGLSGDLRVGLSLEAGQARGRFTETGLERWQESVALYLGGETPLGPTYLGFGKTRSGPYSLYLYIGLP